MKFVMGFVAITSVVHFGVVANNQITNTSSSRRVDKESTQGMPVTMGKGKTLNLNYGDFWSSLRYDADVVMLEEVLEEIEKGRGKSHKYKKLSKTLYPLFMGVLIAKIVLIPLILKTLTAISSAALVMSKISLITTGLLALKWIFSGSGVGEQHTQFELVYVPPAKPYRSSVKHWGDQSWADSNLITDAAVKDQQKYIPVSQSPYRGGYGLNDADAASNLYGYNQHNYQHQRNNDGKPFL